MCCCMAAAGRRANAILAEIRAASGSERLEFHLADLASLSEVRGLADMVSVQA